MNDIHWEDPPPDGRTHHGYAYMQKFVSELKQHPGKWALYVASTGNIWHSNVVATSLKKYGCKTRTSGIGAPLGTPKRAVRVWAYWPEDAET